MKLYIFLLSTLVLSSCSTTQRDRLVDENKTSLNKNQLQSILPAHVLRFESIDFDAKLAFSEDGGFTAQDRANGKDKGKWSINEESKLCLKFSSWYFGDVRCYEVFEESTGKLVLFTTNGARAYSATVVNSEGASRAQTPTAGQKNTTNEHQISSQQTVAPERPEKSSSQRAKETRLTMSNLAANCPGCNFAGADLHDLKLIGANLAGTNMRGADLSGANLRRANLSGADLTDAKMRSTNLAGANLQNAVLDGADLRGANLIKADLTNAKYTTANFSNAYLEGIQGYSKKP